MDIKTTENGIELVMTISGRLDTNAAPELTDKLDELLVKNFKTLILDMGACDYVASSGLRTILSAQKKMNSLSGNMIVKNVVGDVMEVFEMTGFADILTFG